MSAVDAGRRRLPLRGSPEDEAWARAERIAARRARLARKALVYAGVLALLAFVAGRVALIVGLVMGVFLLRRLFREFVEPGLRRRWIEREVDRQLGRRVAAERRHIEDAHAREVSDLAAGVAREMRDPIQSAKELVHRMGEDPCSDENVAHARLALDELGRVERSIAHLLRVAREAALRFRETDLRAIVEAAGAELEAAAGRAGVRLRMGFDGPLLLWGDPEKLQGVAKRLLADAVEAAAAAEDPRVDVSGGLDLAGSEVWLRVRDNGPARRREAGTLAEKIVEGHGGGIEVYAGASGGTEVVVTLPRRRPAETGS